MHGVHHICGSGPLNIEAATIAVVTTVFKDFDHLESTIASVISQRPPDRGVLHIIKDASPTDSGLTLIKDWAERHLQTAPQNLRYQLLYWHNSDRGLYAGLAEAFGLVLQLTQNPKTLLTYLNADDLLEPEALQRVCKLQDATGAEWFVSSPHMIDSRGRTLQRTRGGVPYSQRRIQEGRYIEEDQPFIQQEGSFWSLGLFQRCRGFDPSLRLAGDYDLWLQFAKQQPPLCLPVATGAFRRRPGQKSEDIDGYRREAQQVLAKESAEPALQPASELSFMAVDVDGQPAVAALHADGAPPEELTDPHLAVPLPATSSGTIRLRRRWRREPPHPAAERALASLGLFDRHWVSSQGLESTTLRLRASRAGLHQFNLELLIAAEVPELEIQLDVNGRQRRYRLNTEETAHWPHSGRRIWHQRLQLAELCSPTLTLALRCTNALWTAVRVLPTTRYVTAEAHPAGWPYLDVATSQPQSAASPIALLLDGRSRPSEGREQWLQRLHFSLAALSRQHQPRLQIGLMAAQDQDELEPLLEQFSASLSISPLPELDAPAALAALLEADPDAERIGWLEAGDLLAPSALLRVAQAHQHSPGADLIGGYCQTSQTLQQVTPLTALKPAAGWFWQRQALEQLLGPGGNNRLPRNGLRLGATLVHAAAPAQAAAAAPRLLWINDVGRCGGAGLAHHRLIQAVRQHGSPVLALHAAEHWRPDGHPIGDWSQLTRQIEDFAPDAIVCGNLHGLRCDHQALIQRLAQTAPCYWVAHDFWCSNGRDPYPCLDARQPLPPADEATRRWQEQLASIGRLHLLANSHFSHRALAGTALAPLLLDQPLPLGFERQFNRLNQTSPTSLQDPPSEVQVLVGSVGLDDPRKGAALLAAAIEQLPARSRGQLAVRSYGHTPIHGLHQLCAYQHLGYLDGAGIAAACAQSDVYVNSSLIETFGQVSVEALLGGAWLVSVDNGGVADFAREGVNATLCQPQAKDLSRALHQAIDQHRTLRDQGPEAIERHRNSLALSVDHYNLENSGLQLLQALIDTGVSDGMPLGCLGQPVNANPKGPVARALLR